MVEAIHIMADQEADQEARYSLQRPSLVIHFLQPHLPKVRSQSDELTHGLLEMLSPAGDQVFKAGAYGEH